MNGDQVSSEASNMTGLDASPRSAPSLRLIETIAGMLDLPAEAFFSAQHQPSDTVARHFGRSSIPTMARELLAIFIAIPDESVRQQVLDSARDLASAGG